MTINKFQGKTEEEAKEKARQEMGAYFVFLIVLRFYRTVFLGLFKNTPYEVTAAKYETEQGTPMAAFHSPFKMHEQINLTADEPIQVPPVEHKEAEPAKAETAAEEKPAAEKPKRKCAPRKKKETV